MLKAQDLMSIDLSEIKGILVDIDDTLYSYTKPHQIALSSCYSKFNNMYPDLFSANEFSALYRDARTSITHKLKFSGSCRSRLLAFQLILENLKNSSAVNIYVNALRLEELYWNELILHMNRDEEVFQFLNHCHTMSLKICAVSDMQASIQIRKLEQLGYKNLLLVTSEEVGCEKPNPKIFKQALMKIECTAQNTIMIGDNFDKDIVGAKNIGIKAFQISLMD
jgi:HAD superfamily hydrolase (TIGR01549 family)